MANLTVNSQAPAAASFGNHHMPATTVTGLGDHHLDLQPIEQQQIQAGRRLRLLHATNVELPHLLNQMDLNSDVYAAGENYYYQAVEPSEFGQNPVDDDDPSMLGANLEPHPYIVTDDVLQSGVDLDQHDDAALQQATAVGLLHHQQQQFGAAGEGGANMNGLASPPVVIQYILTGDNNINLMINGQTQQQLVLGHHEQGGQ
ncbi:uncharacterized protein B0T15DRAFT_490976 [Chaetomium strumarium]|uniref:Uncharacterized protein n=1 Tax=Chaetomium strumarium TaxID=1170767 RepID=A0AAJ0M4D3_9PEZI|nr:hypothetical protein B0T15DRAFT_490976 [Chaetomium strumarium]